MVSETAPRLRAVESVSPLFLFACESLAIIFYAEHVERKEITMKISY